VLKIWQHFITQMKSTREVPKPLIYRKRMSYLASHASYLGRVWEKLGLETLAYKTSFYNKLPT